MTKPKNSSKKSGGKRSALKDEDYEDTALKAKHLQERFAPTKKRKDDDMSYLVREKKSGQIKVKNSETHNNTVLRAEEGQISKVYQIDIRSDVVPSLWRCALCGQRSAVDELGDLFGPYYVSIGDISPNFLFKKHSKSQNENGLLDVWFHGDCILWAPDIHMCGNKLTNLSRKLPIFWKQACIACNEPGASISIGNQKHIHFPCAQKKGCVMNESIFSCNLPHN